MARLDAVIVGWLGKTIINKEVTLTFGLLELPFQDIHISEFEVVCAEFLFCPKENVAIGDPRVVEA